MSTTSPELTNEQLRKIIADALSILNQGKPTDPNTEEPITPDDFMLKVDKISTDPYKWKIMHMKDWPELWKVVDVKGKNVATNFVSLAKATQFIEFVLEHKDFPKDIKPTICPTGHHWDETKKQCVEDISPPPPPPHDCPEGTYWDEVSQTCIEGIPPPPPVEGGEIDKFGVKLFYSDGKNIRYDFRENFQGGGSSLRWDYICGKTFLNCELKAYVRAAKSFDDEVSGKMRGGKHSDGLHPKTYDMGIEVMTGKTRYRTEDEHPVYEPGGTGGTGVPLGTNKWIGYGFVCFNEPGDKSVRLEIWQDAGNNEGAKPANDWKKLATWTVKDPLWIVVADDHQETVRIDEAQNANLEMKWQSLAEIKPVPTS